MGRIRNLKDITSHGNIIGRKMAADILEKALVAGDPYHSVRELVHMDGSRLVFDCKDFEAAEDPQSGPAVYDLSKIDRVYVFAIGNGVSSLCTLPVPAKQTTSPSKYPARFLPLVK